MKKISRDSSGMTLVELVVGIAVLAVVAVGVLGLSSTLVSSARYAKLKASALTLATNKMENLKSLPYDSLAVVGGSIVAPTLLPNSETQTVDGYGYTIKTDIDYIDEAFDGCASYPTVALAQQYCRNYPAPTGSPNDTNPKDYKIITVTVLLTKNNKQLSEVSTYVSARVAETGSTTGALFVRVIDGSGTAVSGATVTVVNTSITPNVNQTDNTDSSGIAIFYDLAPDTTNYDYVITASKSGYSTLSTITPTGSLSPYYSSQQIITQQSSQITLTINPQATNSIFGIVTNTSGTPLSGVKIYAKGGYKKYNSTTDFSYYYDNMSPSDTRPTTDGSGNFTATDLAPGPYIFCGDTGVTNCSGGATTYYLVAAVPFGGEYSFSPVTIPNNSSTPPSFLLGSVSYLQKVQLVLSTSSTFPRISSLSPDDVSLASANLANFAFTITGNNLPCSATPGSCSTDVRILSGSDTYDASCTGTNAGLQLDCTVDLSGIGVGQSQLQVEASGQTYTSPIGSLGGFNVVP